MHKGIWIRILLNDQPILHTHSLELHHRAKLDSVILAGFDSWSEILPIVLMNDGDTLKIQMQAGEFSDAPED